MRNKKTVVIQRGGKDLLKFLLFNAYIIWNLVFFVFTKFNLWMALLNIFAFLFYFVFALVNYELFEEIEVEGRKL